MTSFDNLIFKPDRESIRIHGTLAYVTEAERKRILSLPAGQFKPAIEQLERTLKEYRRKPDMVRKMQEDRLLRERLKEYETQTGPSPLPAKND